MKVLLTSVSAGSGHVRAAEAVQAAYWKNRPDVDAFHIDVMQFVAPTFHRMYTGGYAFAVNHAPALWGRLYEFWDQTPPEGGMTAWLYRLQRHYAAPFFRYLARMQPDVLVSTHFLVPQLLAGSHPYPWARRIPLECVITDYDLHRFWISDNVQRYYVAHEELAARLEDAGVPGARIRVSGIPIHPVFHAPVDVALLAQELRLGSGKPVVLVLGGGLGLAMLEHTVQRLFRLSRPMHVVAVCGKNDALRRRLGRLAPPPVSSFTTLGYVRNMHEWLTVSDVVVTKPGGLTLTEGFNKGKAMVLCSAIPGQEEHNADFARRRQAALVAGTESDVPLLVDRILADRALRRTLESNAAACARTDAAYFIADSAARRIPAAA